jgi:uncharacterized protein (DUF302 family)
LLSVIDHRGEAERIGMSMLPTKLLIFGSPPAGTPLMLAAPSCAIDLPLKILVRQDATGTTLVTFNSPIYLRERHGLPAQLLPALTVVEPLATAAAAPA